MAITNLTNTKWYLNDTLEPMGEYKESGWGGAGYSTHYMINFTANDVAFDRFGCEIHESPMSGSQDDMQGELQYKYVSPEGADPCEIPYDYLDSRWYGYAEPYRTIVITGGDDVTNSELIAWLEANATQLDVEDSDNTPDEEQPTKPSATFDLSTLNLPAGEYTIYVKLSAEGYKDSEPSNEVIYEVAGETLMLKYPRIAMEANTMQVYEPSTEVDKVAVYVDGELVDTVDTMITVSVTNVGNQSLDGPHNSAGILLIDGATREYIDLSDIAPGDTWTGRVHMNSEFQYHNAWGDIVSGDYTYSAFSNDYSPTFILLSDCEITAEMDHWDLGGEP